MMDDATREALEATADALKAIREYLVEETGIAKQRGPTGNIIAPSGLARLVTALDDAIGKIEVKRDS